MDKVSRSIGGLFVALVLLALVASPALARESVILRTTKPDNPGLIDVAVRSVAFDADTGEITVTGLVACNAGSVSVVVVDFSAVQRQGRSTLQATTYDDQIACGQEFIVTIPSPPEGTFRPGRAQIEVSALACSLGCTRETLRLDAVLIP